MTTAFYTVAWFVCFYAYKEFAAMLQDMMAGGGAQMQAGIPGFGQQMGGGQQTVGYVVDNRPNRGQYTQVGSSSSQPPRQ